MGSLASSPNYYTSLDDVLDVDVDLSRRALHGWRYLWKHSVAYGPKEV
jgi:hypothetical protein